MILHINITFALQVYILPYYLSLRKCLFTNIVHIRCYLETRTAVYSIILYRKKAREKERKKFTSPHYNICLSYVTKKIASTPYKTFTYRFTSLWQGGHSHKLIIMLIEIETDFHEMTKNSLTV